MNITIIAIIVFIVDRITKLWVVDHFFLGESVSIIPNIFHMTYILNRGAAFGMLAEKQSLFLAIVAGLILGLIYFRKQISNYPKWMQVGIGLLLGGALGNAYDRWSQQAVIDFFDFRIWPIFNVADIAICLGVALIVIYLWKDK